MTEQISDVLFTIGSCDITEDEVITIDIDNNLVVKMSLSIDLAKLLYLMCIKENDDWIGANINRLDGREKLYNGQEHFMKIRGLLPDPKAVLGDDKISCTIGISIESVV